MFSGVLRKCASFSWVGPVSDSLIKLTKRQLVKSRVNEGVPLDSEGPSLARDSIDRRGDGPPHFRGN